MVLVRVEKGEEEKEEEKKTALNKKGEKSWHEQDDNEDDQTHSVSVNVNLVEPPHLLPRNMVQKGK